MAVADRHGLPVAVCVESANPHEVTLATAILIQMIVPEAPQHLIGDNAYDSDKLDEELQQYRIELIAPYRTNRRNPTQDHKTCVGCVDIVDAGRLSGCSRGCKTSAGWSSGTNDMPETFLECLSRMLLNLVEAFMRWLVISTDATLVRIMEGLGE